MEWNAENVLDALNDFERKPEMNPVLEEYLQRIAKNGEIVFPWCKLKPLLKKKLEVVLDEFYETCPVETSVPVPNFETFNFENLKKNILQAVDAFTSAPFTIQRLCELVTNPQKHYNRTDKYMRGIEKNVLVVSTIEPRTGGQGDNSNNNVIVNGMMNESPREDSDALNGHENESNDSVSSSNMNSSSHVLLENFANVFPSAACIPSASSMCINRDIDSNFISTSENVEAPEDIEFESSGASSTESSIDSAVETETKEGDAMDISDEDSFVEPSIDTDETVPQESVDSDSKNKESEVAEDESCVDIQCDSNTVDVLCPDVKEIDNEADSLTTTEEFEPVKSDENSPQVEAVSQSDDISESTNDQESVKTEEPCEQESETIKKVESSTENDEQDVPIDDSVTDNDSVSVTDNDSVSDSGTLCEVESAQKNDEQESEKNEDISCD